VLLLALACGSTVEAVVHKYRRGERTVNRRLVEPDFHLRPHRLTPWERLPLLLAAQDRSDDAEAQRLSTRCRASTSACPDYHGLRDGLMLLTFFHVIGQLERGLLFWQLTVTAADWEEFSIGPADKDRIERLWGLARLTAYRLGVEADGWARFCAELHLDGRRCCATYRGTTLYCTPSRRPERWPGARTRRPTTCAGGDRGDAALPTAAGVAKARRKLLEDRVAWGDGDG
jgi:hypothetical protein